MESISEWTAYWREVISKVFNWVFIQWPLPTIILTFVVTVITMLVLWRLGAFAEVKNVLVGFLVSLGVSIAAFILFVVLIGPFLHLEEIKPKLTELEQLRSENHAFVKMLEDVRIQRDDAVQQQKLFEEAKEYIQDELDKTKDQLNDQKRVIDDLRARLNDRQRRQEIYMNLGVFLDNGEMLKRKVLTEIEQPPPIKEIEEWAEKVHFWLVRYVGPGQAALFGSPPESPSLSHGKPQKHENAWNWIERHLVVIRGLMKDSEFDIPANKQKTVK